MDDIVILPFLSERFFWHYLYQFLFFMYYLFPGLCLLYIYLVRYGVFLTQSFGWGRSTCCYQCRANIWWKSPANFGLLLRRLGLWKGQCRSWNFFVTGTRMYLSSSIRVSIAHSPLSNSQEPLLRTCRLYKDVCAQQWAWHASCVVSNRISSRNKSDR